MSESGLYLFHFEPRYRHARHYLGWSSDIARRVREHASGNVKASPLIRAALAAGCKLRVTRVWIGETRDEERRLKNSGGLSRHCPECRAQGAFHA